MTNTLTARQFARTKLHIAPEVVYRLIRQKRLHATQRNKRWYVASDAQILPGKRRVMAGDDVSKAKRLLNFGAERDERMKATAGKLGITVSALVRQAVDEYVRRVDAC